MSTAKNYDYGTIGVTLTPDQLEDLANTYNAAANEFSLNPDKSGLSESIYGLLNSYLVAPSILGGEPIHNTDEYKAVYAWINGASGVNANSSYFGNYIHTYTASQYTMRYGEISDEDITSKVNQASNEIGLTLAERIIANGGALPSIEGLGAVDAGESARTVFSNSTHQVPEGDYAGWAGTLLFSFLGYDNFFKDWLLETDTVQATIGVGIGEPLTRTTKNIDGTYDYLAALQAHNETVDSFDKLELFTMAIQQLFNFNLDLDNSDLLPLAREYFTKQYGLESNHIFNLENILPFANPNDYLYAGIKSQVGTLGDDVLSSYADEFKNLVINTGKGNDYLLSPNYIANGTAVLYDGGSGIDALDISNIYAYQKITLESSTSELYNWRFQLQEMSSSPLNAAELLAYSVENITSGEVSSWLTVSELSSIDTNVTVDLGGQGVYGNTIDLSKLQYGVELDASQSTTFFELSGGKPLTAQQVLNMDPLGNYLSVTGAANIVGTSYDDTLIGGSFRSVLDGGNGANTLISGGGQTTFVVDRGENTVLNAGMDDRLVIRLPMSEGNEFIELTGGSVIRAKVDGVNGQTVDLAEGTTAYFQPVIPNPMNYSPGLSGMWDMIDSSHGGDFIVRYNMDGSDLNITVSALNSGGSTSFSSVTVKDYQSGNLGISFNEVVVPNYSNAAGSQGSMDAIIQTFIDSQASHIHGWEPPPGLSDVWYVE